MAATLSPHRHLRSIEQPRLRVVAPAGPGPLADLLGARPARTLAALAVALLLVVAGALAIGHGAFASLAPAPPAAVAAAASSAAGTGAARTVVVQPGDTMWSIARRLQPSGDVRLLVDRLVASHGTGVLQPGERLAVSV